MSNGCDVWYDPTDLLGSLLPLARTRVPVSTFVICHDVCLAPTIRPGHHPSSTVVVVDGLTNTLSGLLPRRVIGLLSGAKSMAHHLLARRRYAGLVDALFPTATSCELLAAFDDSAVFRVQAADGTTFILKVGSSPTVDEQLVAEAAALEELAGIDELGDWRELISVVEARGEHDNGNWFTQRALPGAPSLNVDIGADRLMAGAAAAIRPLHQVTTKVAQAGDTLLDSILAAQLASIRRWRIELADQFDAVNSALRSRLGGRSLSLSRVHGDFAPANVLWDPAAREVVGIVDWKLGPELLPPEVDLVHYAIALNVRPGHAEYGDVVIQLIDGGSSVAATTAHTALAAGPNGLDVGLAATLAWLHYASFSLHKAVDLRANRIWLRRNVDQVIERLAAAS